jgi:DNA-binding MarR family transcriptional regulator
MNVNYTKTGIDLFRQIIRCREIDKRLSDRAELTIDEMHCLAVIYLDKPSCVKFLSELLGTNAARTSKILLSLERRGAVIRNVDSADHRKEQITLTESGRQLTENILSLYTEISMKLNLYEDTGTDSSWIARGTTSPE